MKQQDDNKTRELPGLGKRGRKPLGERAMTPAERMKAYRARLKEEKPWRAPEQTSRVAIMQELAGCLARLDDADSKTKESDRWSAEAMVREIVTRYRLTGNHKNDGTKR